MKARVVVEGFTVESDWIETEGLMVSAIEHDGLKVAVRPGSESLSARNSFVVVSSITRRDSTSRYCEDGKGRRCTSCVAYSSPAGA
ncbi:MAG: hypothetical protein MZV63_39090 [Marinilabiliales bacterium]|nr:hypothetical protein [Marinilabiliales bacterium]